MKMKSIQVILVLAILLAGIGQATATDEEELRASLAIECYNIGVLDGLIKSTALLVPLSEDLRVNYNKMVDEMNPMITSHNAMMLLVFPGDPETLSKLLLKPYKHL